MDIDEFLESEAGGEQAKPGRKELVEKQSSEFITDLSIEGEIAKIRELIQARKYKDAEKIYFVVKEQYATLAKRQEDARRKLHRELSAVNKELLEHLDRIKVEMEQKILIINDLLTKARQYMMQGNNEKANELYIQVREIFKQIPDAFGERKMMIENQILTFYSQLVNEFNKKNYGKLLEKRDEIIRHMEIGTNFVNLGNMEQARREYQEINKLYNELPEGFLYEKTVLYKRILTFHQLLEEGVYKETRPAAEMAGMRLGEVRKTILEMPKELEMPQETHIPAAVPIETTTKKRIFGFMKKSEQQAPVMAQAKSKNMIDAPPLPM